MKYTLLFLTLLLGAVQAADYPRVRGVEVLPIVNTFTDNNGATTDPTVADDSLAGYEVGSEWINLVSDTAFKCLDASVGAAVWKQITGTAVVPIQNDDIDDGVIEPTKFAANTDSLFPAIHFAPPSGGFERYLLGSAFTYDEDTKQVGVAIPESTPAYFDLAGGTVLTNEGRYLDTFAAARTLTFSGTPSSGQSIYLKALVTGQTRRITFPASKPIGEANSATTFLDLYPGNHFIQWIYTGEWNVNHSKGLLNNFIATSNPAITDDDTVGYSAGSIWINTTTGVRYTATSVATGAAVWDPIQSKLSAGDGISISGANVISANSPSYDYSISIATSNATPAAVWTNAVATNQAVSLEIKGLSAAATNSAWFKRDYLFQRGANGLALVATNQIAGLFAGSGTQLYAAVDSNNIKVFVLGVADENMLWTVRLNYIVLDRGLPGSIPPVDYLVAEGFEGTGYENTWNETFGSPDEDYTGVILVGSHSFRLSQAGASVQTYTTFTATGEIWGFFKLRPITIQVGNTRTIATVANSAGTTLLASFLVTSGGALRVAGQGGGTATTVATMSNGNTYDVWFRYKKGTGANAEVEAAFIAAGGSKPTSGNNFAGYSTATSTADAARFYLGDNASSTHEYIFDRVLIDNAAIGDNP